MFEIQYFEGINKIDVNELNKWIREFMINNKERLYKEKIVLVTCGNYKMVFSKDIKEYYSLSILQDKKCYMKHYFKEQDIFNEFKDEFMAQFFILRKVSKGEILNIVECKSNDNINKFKVNYNARDISKLPQFPETQVQNRNRKILYCNNCIYVNITENPKLILKCIKRNCRIYDKTEATWCKYYKIGRCYE